jgi:hypothetical protein
MGREHLEKRADPRYESAEKAVLSTEGIPNRLVIIRNFSRGGTFISVIGSPCPIEHDAVDLLVYGSKLRCHVLQQESRGLHCTFCRRMAERETSRHMRNKTGAEASPSRKLPAINDYSSGHPRGERQPLFPLIGTHPDSYVEGWSVGISQHDFSDKMQTATVAVLTSHLDPPDKERWASGFRDALLHSQRIATLPR